MQLHDLRTSLQFLPCKSYQIFWLSSSQELRSACCLTLDLMWNLVDSHTLAVHKSKQRNHQGPRQGMADKVAKLVHQGGDPRLWPTPTQTKFQACRHKQSWATVNSPTRSRFLTTDRQLEWATSCIITQRGYTLHTLQFIKSTTFTVYCVSIGMLSVWNYEERFVCNFTEKYC